jgi:PII-like signaling protein
VTARSARRGAIVFRGLEGYGGTAEIHKAHVVHHDRPILISNVDTAGSGSDSTARLLEPL